jgi:hypothetical protein
MLIAGSRVGYRTQCGLSHHISSFLWVGHYNSKTYIAFCDTLGVIVARDDGSRLTTEPETCQGEFFDSPGELIAGHVDDFGLQTG